MPASWTSGCWNAVGEARASATMGTTISAVDRVVPLRLLALPCPRRRDDPVAAGEGLTWVRHVAVIAAEAVHQDQRQHQRRRAAGPSS